MIDWESSENLYLLNPRLVEEERKRMLSVMEVSQDICGHIWLMTSGSSSMPKWVALSKNAILASAQAVNVHLQSDALDTWLNPLPHFHVGGLGIMARAYLSGAKMIDLGEISQKWCPYLFRQIIANQQITLSALVPTQVYDLVAHKLTSPPSLRALIVGGGAMQENLYSEALKLGWKLLPSYGLTECASQVATAPLENFVFPRLATLQHVEVDLSAEGLIKIKTPSLFTVLATFENFWFLHDSKVDGWYTSEDKGVLKEGFLEIFGRGSNFVKIGGESTSLFRLEAILEDFKLELDDCPDLALLAVPDERLGHVIHLCAATFDQQVIQPLVNRFQESVLPFERIRKIHLVKEIPRSPLKKLLKEELIKSILN